MNDGQITSSPAPIPIASSDEDERIGAVRDADRVRHVEIRGRLVLEGLDLGTEDEPARLEHLGEALLQLGDQRRVLRLDVDKRDHEVRVYRAGGPSTPLSGKRPGAARRG